MLENLLEYYRKSDGKTKKKILSCIFAEKLISLKKKLQSSVRKCECESVSRGKRDENVRDCSRTRSHSRSFSVPGVGLEPTQP
jgi:hypothetical protein